ncbi:MAG: type II secretion system protein [Bacilli bacterium]|nr:type II secretion system protein [Bacilli bacterium]
MKKNGFTLTELLAVIAILGVIVLAVVPNVLKLFNQSVDKFFEQQQGYVLTAAELYVQDNCKKSTRIGYVCPGHYEIVSNNERYLCLKEIQTADYIGEVSYKGNVCEGMVIFDENGKNGQTHLYCGRQSDQSYTYKTSDSINIKSDCKK